MQVKEYALTILISTDSLREVTSHKVKVQYTKY